MQVYKIIVAGVIIIFLALSTGQSLAQTSPTAETLMIELEMLLEQVRQLQTQIASLQSSQLELAGDIREILSLNRNLRRGLSGEDVKLLQQILKTDPDIYPEGLVTGFFGPLTERAVKKFQQKFNIEPIGMVGPITRSRLNQLLTAGAGHSDKVPPGLLIAPGIAKKFDDFSFSPLPGQALPPGIAKKLGAGDITGTTTLDITPPIISDISATSTSATSTRILWQTNESTAATVWYGANTPVAVDATTTASSTITSLSTSHDMLISGLTASTTYYFIIQAKDVADNITTSTEQSFTTLNE